MQHPTLTFISVLTLLLTPICTGYAAENDQQTLVQYHELSVRGGLPNFYAKAEKGDSATVAYFGGSITAHNGWRVFSFDRLQKNFPKSKLTMLPASVGGTGSIVGAFRADNDLIRHRPDLVFIEFAVNDGGDAKKRPDDVLRAMEGIVRKILRENPSADICLVYTLQEVMLADYQKGMFPASASLHEKVAEHYNLPSIGLGAEVMKRLKDGSLVFTSKIVKDGKDADGKLVFSEDKTHPTIPGGHMLYAEVVERCIEKMRKAGKPGPHTLPAPMTADNWENAKTLPVEGNAVFQGEWEKLTAQNERVDGMAVPASVSTVYRTAKPGSSVTIRFKGKVMGIKGLSGPDCGFVGVKIDDKPQTKVCQFNVYSTGRRYVGEPMDALPDGEHTVTWTLLDEMPDKGKILASYWRPGNDKDFNENPAKYAVNRFSVGQIIIIGDVIKK
jgi:lysophospholipase L1-like esterase